MQTHPCKVIVQMYKPGAESIHPFLPECSENSYALLACQKKVLATEWAVFEKQVNGSLLHAWCFL